MMEDHVTDKFIWCDEYTPENRKMMRSLYESALGGDKEGLEELMRIASDCGYREAYG